MLKIFGNWWKGIKGVQLCACSHFSGYATNLFTCRLTYLAPFARAQFLVKLGGMPPNLLGSWRFFFLSYPAGAAAGSCFLLVSFFFLLSSFFFWQHAFFTHFPTSYFDQTWSQWPVPWPLLRHKKWWGQGSPWGHWGQKGHLHQKGIKSFRLRSIDTGLMHMQ